MILLTTGSNPSTASAAWQHTQQQSRRRWHTQHLLALVVTLALGVAATTFTTPAQATVVAEGQLITPLAPAAPEREIRLVNTAPLDPSKPVWVVYSLIAVSDSDKPKGRIVLDAMLEGVPTDIMDTKVIFSAGDLKKSASAGTIGQQLEAQMGQRTPEQLTEDFGPDLYAAYKALNEKRGSILQGAIVKTYNPVGGADAMLLASVARVEGMQPMLVTFTMGQGEVPAALKAQESSRIPSIAIILGILFVATFALRQLRK